MMKQIIIDANYLCWTSHFKMKQLRIQTDDGDIPTGVIYGFIRKILDLSIMFRSNQFYFCFDGADNLRKKIFPGYKAGRNKDSQDRKDVTLQINLLLEEILPKLGFGAICYEKGYEADDLMAKLTAQFGSIGKVIVTGDEDLYQLLSRATSQYIPVKKKLYTILDFKREHHNLESYEWASYKAIAGCSSDKIPGIKGMGEKKTYHLMSKNEWEDDLSDDDWDTYNFFLKLTKLPYLGTPEQEFFEDEFSLKAFISVCEEYEFDSLLLHDLENWGRLVSGDFSTAKERISNSLSQRSKRRLLDA